MVLLVAVAIFALPIGKNRWQIPEGVLSREMGRGALAKPFEGVKCLPCVNRPEKVCEV